jgi:pimeloyl-ACP methyl ester carboxylesterase
MDTWRTWELVLPALERGHDVLAPTLPGHAGGPPAVATVERAADEIERMMEEAGFETAHIVGNSLGGYLALELAARGRADSVVALAPAGGWDDDGESLRETLALQRSIHEAVKSLAPHAEAIVARPEGRRRATQYIAERYEHIPPELIAHQIRGAASEPILTMIENAQHEPWDLDAERITVPVRIVWGTEDRLLPWPSAAARFRNDWLPDADWVVLDGVGHAPQLDVPLETSQLIADFTAW